MDDLTADEIERMKAQGFAVAMVVETSPWNFQAWLNHGQGPKHVSTLAARSLADRFGGDKGAADWQLCETGDASALLDLAHLQRRSTGTRLRNTREKADHKDSFRHII